jgi:UDP-N-acetylglucosamine 2-epimerase (non-hydrolysing)
MANSEVIPQVEPLLRSSVPEVVLRASVKGDRPRVFCLFGTRPEVIKLASVIQELKRPERGLEVTALCSGQHDSLVAPLLSLFNVAPEYDLQVMQPRQTPNDVCARVLERLGPIVADKSPDLMVVQGDTTTALAGALAAFHHKVPVAHVEAGLRSGNPESPFPEEMNRRLITRLATYHFAATPRNREALLQEGVPESSVFVTGNPVVDALQHILRSSPVSEKTRLLLDRVGEQKMLVLTTHRRENFGDTMRDNLRTLRSFVDNHEDVSLVFAVHPNPNVVEVAKAELSGHARIQLIDPLDYSDFIHLLRHAWMVVSDSGGIQEEAPSLSKPLLVLRSNTERQEAIDCGAAVLVGDDPARLASILENVYRDSTWADSMKRIRNPFGDGTAACRIADAITNSLCVTRRRVRGISR